MLVVPSVDVRDGKIVFRGGVAADVEPRDLARRFVTAGAEELHLVDLDAAETGEPRNFALLSEIARAHRIPSRLAGGVDSLETAQRALSAGFTGALFSSAVFGDDALLPRIATLGEHAIVELEARDDALDPRGGDPSLVARARGQDVVTAAIRAVAQGVRALYVIDLSTDGRLGGPALALLARVREAVPSAALHTGGGIRDLADLTTLARMGVASAVVGRALADGRFTLAQAKAVCA
ncbi:MAG: hypothetical protein HY071_00975 [Chloroflexi bacterium]|nr:hypothetical protein [Chloroflexota bacterium]